MKKLSRTVKSEVQQALDLTFEVQQALDSTFEVQQTLDLTFEVQHLLVSPLPDLEKRSLKKGKSSEFNSGDDGLIILTGLKLLSGSKWAKTLVVRNTRR